MIHNHAYLYSSYYCIRLQATYSLCLISALGLAVLLQELEPGPGDYINLYSGLQVGWGKAYLSTVRRKQKITTAVHKLFMEALADELAQAERRDQQQLF